MSKPKQPLKRDDPEQSRRFEEAAKELGADESGESFERAIKAVAPKGPAVKAPVRRAAKPR